ncbi:MAG: hypothetical protein ACUVS3_05670 [Thermodesulfobacteriota bacterium]
MKARLKLVADRGTQAACGLQLRLVAVPPHGGEPLSLTEACSTMSALEAEVDQLCRDLMALLGEARDLMAKAQKEAAPLQELPENAKELWELMERCGSLEEMKRLFNALQDGKRRELADFIFGNVNVFKGAGAMFAQHYDEEQGRLE